MSSATRSAEPSSGGFSYAQAAKGRSTASAASSGVATPSSAVADGLADDPKADAHNHAGGDSSSVTSANQNDDSASTPNPASSESTWDTKSQTSERQSKSAEANGTDPAEDAPKQQKPKLQEAPPPAVNVWQQRAQQLAQVKPAPTPVKQDKKPDVKKHAEAKKPVATSPKNREQRQPADATRARPTTVIPPPAGSDVAWPSMETARQEDRKKVQVQEEKAEKSLQKESSEAPAPKAGKTEWVNLPYVPTAVFETSLPTRGSGGAARTGRGGARGGSHGSARSTFQGQAAADKSQPRSTDPSQEQNAVAADADLESTAPQSKPAKAEGPKDTASVNGVAQDAPPAGTLRSHPSLRRDRSPRKSEKAGRRSSVASFYPDGHSANQSEAAEHMAKERPFDNPPPFREGKGSKRGRGGHRGLTNGHYSSQQYANGFPGDYPAAQYPPRGGHYPQQSRNGFRNPSIRSQSIPFDYNRGQYPGYPMMMPQSYVPEYYPSFSPTALSAYQPSIEQGFLVSSISQQIEYYFSVENLIKDLFFRKHMDSQGFVYLSLVADFNRLKSLTTDYELLKYVCLNSPNIELRVGQDGKDRLRKAGDWERWVLPLSERHPSAQTEGPSSFERPPLPQLGMAAPFYPAGAEQFAESPAQEEFRGRRTKSPHRENGMSPLGNFFVPAEDMGGDLDNFPSEQIENLTVVVRKHKDAPSRAPFHTAGSRTFSDGSIDTKNIYEEVQTSNASDKKPQTNGEHSTNGDAVAADSPAVTLFWVKDQNSPVDTLPPDTTHEMYTNLRTKALSQREVAATGTCPYDMDVLYQFWSHFLIRNFNSSMYAEFRHLAFADASQRHNDTGMNNLIKYYSEALASQIAVRERVGQHFVELIHSEKAGGERPAFIQLQSSWRNGSLNLKNRKRFNDMLDHELKAELEA